MGIAGLKEVSKGCHGNCAFTIEEVSTTMAGWVQIFDKDGNDISRPNPNRIRSTYTCRECGKEWDVVEQSGKVLSCELTDEG